MLVCWFANVIKVNACDVCVHEQVNVIFGGTVERLAWRQCGGFRAGSAPWTVPPPPDSLTSGWSCMMKNLEVIWHLSPLPKSLLERKEAEQKCFWYILFQILLNCYSAFRNWSVTLVSLDTQTLTGNLLSGRIYFLFLWFQDFQCPEFLDFLFCSCWADQLLASDFLPPLFHFFSCIDSPVFLNLLQSNQPQALKGAPKGSNNCK